MRDGSVDTAPDTMLRRGATSGFSIPELLATLAIILVLAAAGVAAWHAAMLQADRADALAKIRTMGTAVLQYTHDHGGMLPPLFPGQVLEYEAGRGGRIVTECAPYLGVEATPERHLVADLMPRAYARLGSPDPGALRVCVMNTSVTNNSGTIAPFGSVVVGGQPPVGAVPLVQIGDQTGLWMMSTADQQHPNVAAAPWKNNAPPDPPLQDMRAVFHFDGSAVLEKTR